MFGKNKKNDTTPLAKGVGSGVGDTPAYTEEEARLAGGRNFHDPQTHGALPLGSTNMDEVSFETRENSQLNQQENNQFSNDNSFGMSSFNGFGNIETNSFETPNFNSFGMSSPSHQTNEKETTKNEIINNTTGDKFDFGGVDNVKNEHMFAESPTTNIKPVNPFETIAEKAPQTGEELKIAQNETLKKNGLPTKAIATIVTIATIGLVGAGGYKVYQNKKHQNQQTEIVEQEETTIEDELPKIDDFMASNVNGSNPSITNNEIENHDNQIASDISNVVENVNQASEPTAVASNSNTQKEDIVQKEQSIKEVKLTQETVTASSPTLPTVEPVVKEQKVELSKEEKKIEIEPQNDDKNQKDAAKETNISQIKSETVTIDKKPIVSENNGVNVNSVSETKVVKEVKVVEKQEQQKENNSIDTENSITNTQSNSSAEVKQGVAEPKISYEQRIRQMRAEAQMLSDKADALVRERNSLERELFGKSKDEQIEILKREIADLKAKQRKRVENTKKRDLENKKLINEINGISNEKEKRITRQSKTQNAIKNKSEPKKEKFAQSENTRSAIKGNKLPYHVYAATSGILLLKEGQGRPAISYVAGDRLPNGETIVNIDYFGKKLKTNRKTYNW